MIYRDFISTQTRKTYTYVFAKELMVTLNLHILLSQNTTGEYLT